MHILPRPVKYCYCDNTLKSLSNIIHWLSRILINSLSSQNIFWITHSILRVSHKKTRKNSPDIRRDCEVGKM